LTICRTFCLVSDRPLHSSLHVLFPTPVRIKTLHREERHHPFRPLSYWNADVKLFETISWAGLYSVRLVGTLICLQGLPFKHLTHKRRLTTRPSHTGFSTLDCAGQFRCQLVATCLAGPHYHSPFSSISTSGGPIPDVGALHCTPSSCSTERGYPGGRRDCCASSCCCIIGLHWSGSRRVGAVFISKPSGPAEHLVVQFRTSYIYHHWPTPRSISFLALPIPIIPRPRQ